MFGLTEVAAYTHHLEELLALARAGKLEIDRTIRDVLLRGADVMHGLVEAARTGAAFDPARVASSLAEIRPHVDRAAEGAARPVAAAAPPAATPKASDERRAHPHGLAF